MYSELHKAPVDKLMLYQKLIYIKFSAFYCCNAHHFGEVVRTQLGALLLVKWSFSNFN